MLAYANGAASCHDDALATLLQTQDNAPLLINTRIFKAVVDLQAARGLSSISKLELSQLKATKLAAQLKRAGYERLDNPAQKGGRWVLRAKGELTLETFYIKADISDAMRERIAFDITSRYSALIQDKGRDALLGIIMAPFYAENDTGGQSGYDSSGQHETEGAVTVVSFKDGAPSYANKW